MPQDDLDVLTLAGLLHDVGKMKIPEEIIKKPGILTEEEYTEIKNHPRRGYNLLKPMKLDERIKKVALSVVMEVVIRMACGEIRLMSLRRSWQLPMYMMH